MRQRPSPRVYRAYGLRLRSPWPLPCPEDRKGRGADVELVEATAGFPARAPRNGWFHYARLPGGADHLRWSGLAEFVVSADGRRVSCRPATGVGREALLAYLLGQVLSFAMLKRGLEPLHATCVAVDGRAIAFLGDCGAGKSTLGAAFLRAGHALVTDDLLVVGPRGDGYLAHFGMPRIKLFPETARRLLGEVAGATPMNGFTPKLVIPLGGGVRAVLGRPVPLAALYVLAPPATGRPDRFGIRPLGARRAFLELLRNTFNTVIVDPARLRRQLDVIARLAGAVPVRRLAFPRGLARLDAVCEAIRADVAA